MGAETQSITSGLKGRLPALLDVSQKVRFIDKCHWLVASQIGRFGIGLVSVYQITDTPIIRSAGIEMKLVPLDGTGATRSIPDSAGSEFELRWASMSTHTRKALNASPTPADTTMTLDRPT
jgi:hypothetical protein